MTRELIGFDTTYYPSVVDVVNNPSVFTATGTKESSIVASDFLPIYYKPNNSKCQLGLKLIT